MIKELNAVILFIIVAFLLPGLTSCGEADSSDIRTSGVYAKVKASANESGITDVKVRLTLGLLSNTVIDISGGDRLTATAGGVTKALRKDSSIIGDIKYVADFDVGNDLGTKFYVSFLREDGLSAPNSVGSLPAPFVIDMPSSGSSFNQNDRIVLVWSPVGAFNRRIDVDVSNDCGYVKHKTSLHSPVDSAGTTEYQATDFLPPGLQPGTACVTRITLRRKINGSVDSNYEGGYYNIEQRRSVTINIVP